MAAGVDSLNVATAVAIALYRLASSAILITNTGYMTY